mmetsp:Transcript_21779/g.51855  ORF Transcript_21779/g.51855 Transcript_21779/m.51855 type:complete len:130 (+) Transcript_21779:160-549(+)
MANLYNRWEQRLTLRLMFSRAPVKKIKPLDDERAVNLATEALGELLMFSVAGAVIVTEVHFSRQKEQAQEEKEQQRRNDVEERLLSLQSEVETLQGKIAELHNLPKEVPKSDPPAPAAGSQTSKRWWWS